MLMGKFDSFLFEQFSSEFHQQWLCVRTHLNRGAPSTAKRSVQAAEGPLTPLPQGDTPHSSDGLTGYSSFTYPQREASRAGRWKARAAGR